MIQHRTTPDNILALRDNEIFVFGSNMSGAHGAGAALTAVRKFGAINGKGEGLVGESYGIPTKDRNICTLSLDKIAPKVKRFIKVAKRNPNLTFLVTEIGCGLAGYRPRDIAPLFKEAEDVQNIHLPTSFWVEIAKINGQQPTKSTRYTSGPSTNRYSIR